MKFVSIHCKESIQPLREAPKLGPSNEDHSKMLGESIDLRRCQYLFKTRMGRRHTAVVGVLGMLFCRFDCAVAAVGYGTRRRRKSFDTPLAAEAHLPSQGGKSQAPQLHEKRRSWSDRPCTIVGGANVETRTVGDGCRALQPLLLYICFWKRQ